MHPILWDSGLELNGLPVRLYSYGLCMMIGLCMGMGSFLVWGARRHPIQELYVLSLLVFLAGLLGSKVLFVVANIDYYVALPAWKISLGGTRLSLPPVRDYLASGMVWYGGLVGAIPVGVGYALVRHLGVLEVADAAAPAIGLGHAWGRIGCFLAGCCYGGEASVPPGVSFPRQSVAFMELAHEKIIEPAAGSTMPLHPTQLYEVAAEVVILAVLLLSTRWKRFSGQVAGTYLVIYAIVRPFIEVFRGDLSRGSISGYSTSQIVSVPLLAFGLALLVFSRLWSTRSLEGTIDSRDP